MPIHSHGGVCFCGPLFLGHLRNGKEPRSRDRVSGGKEFRYMVRKVMKGTQ